jgi:2-amino-4-hydroxy-6-hydroxymethyldihydropteridine diphosphokinase
MSMVRTAIGVGSNLGDRMGTVRAAVRQLESVGRIVAQSRLYRSKPWGVQEQPEFCNAVVVLETELSPHVLLEQLKNIEARLGRAPSERWGPRRIDLDILLYGEQRVDEPELQVPHPRLFERGFALIPLAEVDKRYADRIAGLPPGERESVALMSEDQIVERVRALAQTFLETDLMRIRIEDPNDDAVELRRKAIVSAAPSQESSAGASPPPVPVHVESIKADLVGIVHLTRPAVTEGERLSGDRELAYVEALGIRNPIRSFGHGRVVNVLCHDGEPVEYGQVLFEIDRG